jgi:hypothetical protein
MWPNPRLDIGCCRAMVYVYLYRMAQETVPARYIGIRSGN